ncbi:hypothetical protein K432DRAFT_383962 [Lepidopterella palustris CBS 459.81]|uniref:Ubiquitin 3 binding protein But2 C-terminal domain-containing protein n=1 Tax=Lepidopterella palustris CBS 459.81 TaxID=1314670 RepID=A0A8E2JDR7_9PEZI|nr:hypothetical protein K432DRAFT_383962 [Lepidopterella palustris CBS 459.81]
MHLNFILAAALVGVRTSLAGLIDREFPHLIIPLHQDNPMYPYGTQYYGNIQIQDGAHQIWTEISFDVPPNVASSCNLAFAFPPGAPWTLSGDESLGPLTFDVWYISPAMNQSRDAWNQNTRPAVQSWVANVQVGYDGFVQIIGGSVSCAKGQVAQFLLSPGSERSFGLSWFEEANPINGITYEMWD